MHEERASHPDKFWTNSWSTSQDGVGLVCFTALANGTRDATWTTQKPLSSISSPLGSSQLRFPAQHLNLHPPSFFLSIFKLAQEMVHLLVCTLLSLLHSTSELHKWLSQQGTTASEPPTSLLSCESWLILSSILTSVSLVWKSWSSADTFESQV